MRGSLCIDGDSPCCLASIIATEECGCEASIEDPNELSTFKAPHRTYSFCNDGLQFVLTHSAFQPQARNLQAIPRTAIF